MATNRTDKLPHPAYGLAEATRLRVLEDAERYGVRAAAEVHGLSDTIVYIWRKRYGFASKLVTKKGN